MFRFLRRAVAVVKPGHANGLSRRRISSRLLNGGLSDSV
jgi:hypothetical protein